MEENIRFYKVVKGSQIDGLTISTRDCYNNSRFQNYKRLSTFFECACRFSNNYDASMDSILEYCDVNNEDPISIFSIGVKGEKELQFLRHVARMRNFIYSLDSAFYIDFVLEKARKDMQILFWKRLPSRFKSSFFFESIADCVNYGCAFNQYGPFQIIEVEFIQTKRQVLFDNSLISDFSRFYTSNEFLQQAKRYLSGEISENPVYEIVFQGKYKIISHFPLTV